MQSTIVMKFGGTSVGSVERIGKVAKRVVELKRETGSPVVVVVSAMSGETDRLLELRRKVTDKSYPKREEDQLLASGEQVSSALTAMAIARLGEKSQSLLAYQIPLKTKAVLGQNFIADVCPKRLRALLDDDVIPVVAGFQGVDESENFTTLGRGGSDTTAVALAAALKPAKCYILTDVPGVFTALPSICKKAKQQEFLSYEEMLELASSGAKVLQARSVALARKHKVPLIVASSFENSPGTEIVEEYTGMEDAVVSGITCRIDEAKITLRDIPDEPGIAAKILSVLGDETVIVDMIVQSHGVGGRTSLGLTVPEESVDVAFTALQKLAHKEMPDAHIDIDKNIAKLSVVGEGMRNHAGIAAKIFEILGNEHINIEMITTSEIKVSVAIHQKYAELAVRILHEHFIE